MDHSAKKYVIGAIHTNTIEGFWSIFKHGIVGSFHEVSNKYKPLYVAEFQFRYNNRENADIFRNGDRRMLRRLINGEIAIGFAGATLLWIAVLGWTTSYAPTDPEKEACYQTAAKSGHNINECKTFWEKTTSDPVVAFTLVLAFSTVGLWIATIGLYFAGERQIKLARETSARQAIETERQLTFARDEFMSSHRPKIRIKHVWLVSDMWESEAIVINVVCVNMGMTCSPTCPRL